MSDETNPPPAPTTSTSRTSDAAPPDGDGGSDGGTRAGGHRPLPGGSCIRPRGAKYVVCLIPDAPDGDPPGPSTRKGDGGTGDAP